MREDKSKRDWQRCLRDLVSPIAKRIISGFKLTVFASRRKSVTFANVSLTTSLIFK